MADKTLIQGARELAASKATSGIGAAMSAGFSGVQERTAARNAAINEQGRKEADAIKARSAKNMSGWKGLGDLDQGIFPEAQQKEIRKTVFGIKDKFSKVATALAYDPTNLDLIEERDGYLTEMVAYKDSLDKVINFRRDYKENVDGYSNSGANVPALNLNELFSNPDSVLKWDTQAGLNLPGEDGSDPLRFRDLTLPFSLPEGSFKYVSEFAGELSVPRKYEWNKGQITAKQAEMQDYIGARDPNTGVNNAPAILADDRFRSFFPEFEDIVYTEENHEAVTAEMADIVMGRYKFIASGAKVGDKSTPANPVIKSMEDIQDHYNLGKTGVQYSADDLKFIFGSTTAPISVVYNPKRKESPWEMTRKTLDPNDGTLSTETIYFRNVEDLQQRSGIKF